MTPRRLFLGIIVAVASAACDRPPPPRAQAPGPDAANATPAAEPSATSTAISTPTATSTATSTTTSTTTSTATPLSTTVRPPAPPATAILRTAVAVEPAARLPLAPGSEVVVAPAATFEVELSARVPDARLVLVDAREDLVPANATRELAAGTKLTLAPAAPLVPGSRYALRLDGAARRDLYDESGRSFSAVSLPLLAAGAPPPPEPKSPARKRKRR